MNVQPVFVEDDIQGRAAFGMANLRMAKTGPPFIVFISKTDGAKHDARVKGSPAPKVRTDRMSSYAVRPFGYKGGPRLSKDEETMLAAWVDLNQDILVGYWDGDIEYTDEATDRLISL